MTSRIAAAVFALLTVTAAPAHANFIENLDADVNLNYGSSEQLTGSIDLTYNPYDFHPGSNPYNLTASLSLNGTPLTPVFIGNTGYPGTQDYFTSFTPGGPALFNLEINTADIGNLNFADFVGATSGTVTVLSETMGTPLPDALPMFGAAMIALGGFAAWRSRRAGQG
jgi:hypothetical protein